MNSEELSFFDGNITINADICNGKPTIYGTKIFTSKDSIDREE
jgi:uncharacterized protein (DUF433 family)